MLKNKKGFALISTIIAIAVVLGVGGIIIWGILAQVNKLFSGTVGKIILFSVLAIAVILIVANWKKLRFGISKLLKKII